MGRRSNVLDVIASGNNNRQRLSHPTTSTTVTAAAAATATTTTTAELASEEEEEEEGKEKGERKGEQKGKRKGKEQEDAPRITDAASIPLPPSPLLKPKKHRTPRTPRTTPEASLPATITTSTTMPPPTPIPLFICSIGNPGAAYAHTLHSAGHTLLASLANLLQASPFVKDKAYANGLVSRPGFGSAQPPWTLYQSPSYMNESGKPIAKAYATWRKTLASGSSGGGGEGRVVILHDELEKPLGAVSVREGQGLSARGHNGIKSLLAHMGKTGFVRVGVGIGRPLSREPDQVAKYVLKKMSPAERMRVEEAAGEAFERLRALSGV